MPLEPLPHTNLTELTDLTKGPSCKCGWKLPRGFLSEIDFSRVGLRHADLIANNANHIHVSIWCPNCDGTFKVPLLDKRLYMRMRNLHARLATEAQAVSAVEYLDSKVEEVVEEAITSHSVEFSMISYVMTCQIVNAILADTYDRKEIDSRVEGTIKLLRAAVEAELETDNKTIS
jgi:hypothetical protein